jgi:hypothetical protein
LDKGTVVIPIVIRDAVVIVIIITGIPECVTISIGLTWVGHEGADVVEVIRPVIVIIWITRITGAIALVIELAEVGDERAVVRSVEDVVIIIIVVTGVTNIV